MNTKRQLSRYLGSLILPLGLFNLSSSATDPESGFTAGLAARDRGHFATAFRTWMPLANEGFAEAQNNIGHMYETGQGVTRSFTEAMRWYRLAADAELPQAQHNLGLLYFHGYGVPADKSEAVTWFTLAAEQNLAESQYMLGVVHQQGDGADLDYAEARRRFRQSSLNGYADAQLMYAYMLQAGEGGEPDPFHAYIWARIAQHHGQPGALDLIGVAVLLLNRNDLSRAETLLTACLADGLHTCP